MAKMQIAYEGNKVLRKKAQEVKVVDHLVGQLLDDMLDTMHANNGIGLAAPQVGISKRIIVIELPDDEDGPIKMINPRIVEKEGSVVGLEGCLSIPNVYGDVERAEKVVVKGLDEKGKPSRIEASGLLARVFQHEVDHLDGVLFTDVATNVRAYSKEELEQAEEEGRYEPALDTV
ncbi:MAG: peptide deformylase [Armatimonadetes bacterium]|nr:peptide deformylase [Armatimonadota bacterium]